MASAFEITKKREALKGAYPQSIKWAKKVNLMPPDQVVAVYFRLLQQNKLKGK